MKHLHIVSKIKVVILLVVSLFVSSFVSNTVFIAGTPHLNMQFLAQVKDSPVAIWSSTREYIAQLGSGSKDEYVAYQRQEVARSIPVIDTLSTEIPPPRHIPTISTAPVAPPIASNPINTRRQELTAQGYIQTDTNSYEKVDVAAKTISVVVLPETEFIQTQVTFDGQPVTMWAPAE